MDRLGYRCLLCRIQHSGIFLTTAPRLLVHGFDQILRYRSAIKTERICTGPYRLSCSEITAIHPKVSAANYMSTKALNQSNRSTFRFGFIDDSHDTSDHGVKVRFDFASAGLTNIAEGYSNGHLYVVLPLKSALCNCKRYLVFFVNGGTLENCNRFCSAASFKIGHCDTSFPSHGNDDSVFGTVTDFVYCKEKIVRSAVRFIAFPEPRNLFGKIFATTPYATFEIIGSFAEREIDTITREITEPSDGCSSQVERRPEIFDSFNCVLCEAFWKRFEEFEAVPFINAIRLRLDDTSAWCTAEIPLRYPLKLSNVFLSPFNSESSIFEDAGRSSYHRRMKSKPEPSVEFKNFDSTVRQVLSVSKEELQRREAAYKAKREGKPKRGPKPKASAQ